MLIKGATDILVSGCWDNHEHQRLDPIKIRDRHMKR